MSNNSKFSQEEYMSKGVGKIRRPPRELSKLTKFDPYSRKGKKTSHDQIISWDFFESGDSVEIDSSIVGRVAVNPQHDANFFYLGRQTNTLKPTIVKFSVYQSTKIASLIALVLDQYEDMKAEQEENGLENIPIIPMLREKGELTYYTRTEDNRLNFWQQFKDLDLGTIRVACILNKTVGLPEIMLNMPVPVETSEKMGGWPGPVLTLGLKAAANLESFILSQRRDTLDMHMHVRSKAIGGE